MSIGLMSNNAKGLTMASGFSNQLTKQLGEYLVSAELCRRSFIATTFTGNVPEIDIIALNDRYQTIQIQVKASKKGNWQMKADSFLDIKYDQATQTQKILGKLSLLNPDIICVFVRINLDDRMKDEFYVLNITEVQEIILQNHSESLRIHGSKRPKNPESMHCAITIESLKHFQDNWEILCHQKLL